MKFNPNENDNLILSSQQEANRQSILRSITVEPIESQHRKKNNNNNNNNNSIQTIQ